MRIIAGKYKRRQLNYPKDDPALRPTKDMVREGVFSIIQNQVPNSRFLDLFAGVGGVGLEALSRGASEIVMIDIDPKYIFENARLLNCLAEVEIYKNDYARAVEILAKKQRQFDLIYLDPPYHKDLIPQVLAKIKDFNILAKDGIIVLETFKDNKLALANVVSERNYGGTKIIVLENK